MVVNTGRRIDVLREIAADALDLRPDVLRRRVDVASELELDRHLRHAFERDRRDAIDAFHRIEGFLHPARHLALDRLRARARVDRLHGDDGNVHLGELVDCKSAIAEDAEDDQAEHHHRREDRSADRDAAQSAAALMGRRMGLVRLARHRAVS